MSVFSRFPERLQHAIAHELGFKSLRPVQELAGEAILDGKNAVILAPTAGGKTEASMFPVIAGLVKEPPSGVGALYVAPIKALLNNQEIRLGKYTEMVGLRRFVWHGDAQQSQKAAFLREPAELLMTTPESLEVMLMSPRVPVQTLFKDLRYVVIDEIHAFAGSDRGAHLMSVIERLRDISQHDVQRIGLSATVGNPDQIVQWIAGTSKREGVLIDPPKPKAERRIAIYLREDVSDFGRTAVREGKGKKSLFFCQSRALTETVAEQMRDDSIEVFVHHGSVSKEERQAAEERFATGTNACIVATSTLELGIDVGGLDLTFQANAPSTVSSFLQRMGRTGRREGTVANMTFLCEDTVYVVQNTALVLLAARGWVESVKVETRCWPVLVHQLLAMTQQFGGISAERAWPMLERVPDFRGITKDEYLALVEHMKREGYLFEAGGLLSLGQKAEKVFGKKNFLELYAVFSTPQLYKVQTESKRDLGSLEQAFVDRLVDEMSTFLLGGRAWLVVAVNHDERLVRVRPAPRGKKPSWGGYIPQFLGFDLFSIRPAWAWMIIHLQAQRWKDVENRTWTTKYRGPLLIQASQGLTHEEYEDACALALSAGQVAPSQLPKFHDIELIRGQLIGAVKLSNVAPPGNVVSPWHHPDSYGWQLAERVAFTPRPLAGKLSLYEVEPTPGELATLQAAGFL